MPTLMTSILIVGDSEVDVIKYIQKTIQVLVQAGYVVNLKMSKLVPKQDLMYIGARFCMDLGRLYLPEIRI